MAGRINLGMNEATRERLDRLRRRMGAASSAEVVRRALEALEASLDEPACAKCGE